MQEDERNRWTLDQWVNGFHYIFGPANSEKLPTTLWLEAVDEASKLAEEIRKSNLSEEVVHHVARLFGWVCTFVGKYLVQTAGFNPGDPLQLLLQETNPDSFLHPEPESYFKWVLEKYPAVCGLCGCSPCVCGVRRDLAENRYREAQAWNKFLEQSGKRLVEARKKVTKRYPKLKTMPLDQQMDVMVQIFRGSNYEADLWKITAHLLEEMGEVAREILALEALASFRVQLTGNGKSEDLSSDFRHRAQERLEKRFGLRKRDAVSYISQDAVIDIIQRLRVDSCSKLKGELADVFSWICALLHKIGYLRRSARDGSGEEEKFALILSGYYMNVDRRRACPYCERSTCDRLCQVIRIWEKREAVTREDAAVR
jgi:NTP pyrophosphatase (non-canonical NTP hydrolase)